MYFLEQSRLVCQPSLAPVLCPGEVEYTVFYKIILAKKTSILPTYRRCRSEVNKILTRPKQIRIIRARMM